VGNCCAQQAAAGEQAGSQQARAHVIINAHGARAAHLRLQ
jgi:hypothetical protein